ncbi:DUF5810 domain-containing protein [Natrialba asiatica]|uniref:Uncharacterized protein n=1 Tax=Natrialba asiatica (strain ATCC 700177 / DSM 12278 / JCM 9576 / FERM P-10747 / NBRC 102637 / 172P1) TaxID=29540 RepID=M0B3K9_NATA1|nr:DUF5810 domain-containing protein [Natrialba asiatica]ELZ04828.1 hypothetical protein C481_03577 [Natrialba asiatica DSM 12278]
MGYACPVCDAEQADAEHLANHLAITASLDRPDHKEWLEEHAPDWADHSPAELGEIVREHAPEIDTPEFESAGRGGHDDHDHGRDRAPGRPTGIDSDLAGQRRQPSRGSMTAEAERALQEAQEMTQQMLADAADDADAADPDDDEATDD